jgi:hypothetical protein
MDAERKKSEEVQAWLRETALTLDRPPKLEHISFGSRHGKVCARFVKHADLSIMSLVENVVRESFGGRTCRAALGLAAFGRKVIVNDDYTILLYATPWDGTGIVNTCPLPPFLSRRSRAANALVVQIAKETSRALADPPEFSDERASYPKCAYEPRWFHLLAWPLWLLMVPVFYLIEAWTWFWLPRCPKCGAKFPHAHTWRCQVCRRSYRNMEKC